MAQDSCWYLTTNWIIAFLHTHKSRISWVMQLPLVLVPRFRILSRANFRFSLGDFNKKKKKKIIEILRDIKMILQRCTVSCM